MVEQANVVLIGETDADRRALSTALELRGHSVREYPALCDGVREIRRRSPDVVFFSAPVDDQAKRWLADRAGRGDAALIVASDGCSGSGCPFLRFAAGCLHKPYRPADAIVLIEGQLELLHLRQALDARDEEVARLRQRDDELSAELQRQRDREEARTRIVQMAVHDLRNPLAAADANVAFMRQEDASSEVLLEVQDGLQRVNRMVATMLDVLCAEDERLQLRRTPTPLGELVATVAEETARGWGLTVDLEVDPDLEDLRLAMDPDLVGRIVSNVLENALKYGGGGPVRCRAYREQGNLALDISDRGEGIPPEDRTRIFEARQRLQTGSARRGRGLGLAFCKLAVEAHGGAIYVEDNEPGARFCVRLPLQSCQGCGRLESCAEWRARGGEGSCRYDEAPPKAPGSTAGGTSWGRAKR